MERTTESELQLIVDRINNLTGSRMEPYALSSASGFTANLGCYHLSRRLMGLALHRVQSADGAVVDVLGRGHMPKGELHSRLAKYILTLEAKRAAA